MGWSIGYDETWKRFIGYGVPAYCDHPKCDKKIDRGLAYVCGGEPYGGEHGCGLFFCDAHLSLSGGRGPLCSRCLWYKHKPFTPKPEHPEWIKHLRTHHSWAKWRAEDPLELERMTASASG